MMARALKPGCLAPHTPGPWMVDTIGRYWYVIHSDTLRAKRIGPMRWKGTNYCDRALQEANARNIREAR